MSFKKTLFMGAAVAVSTATLVGLGAASAAPDDVRLDKEKITGVVKSEEGQAKGVRGEELADYKAQVEQNWEASLDELVRSGKLTEEQKAKIQAKQAELKTQMDAELKMDLRNKTKEEMSAIAEARHAALEAWAAANGIPDEYAYLALGIPHAKAPNIMVAPSAGATVTNSANL